MTPDPRDGDPLPWIVVPKFTPAAARLADGHYSRRTIGSPQFMPPGQTLVLLTPDCLAVFGWWRPDPRSGIVAMNKLDGWTCSIFRNTGPGLSSELILAAELELVGRYDCGPDGMLTYVWDAKVRSSNPGYCFKRAGWRVRGRSADGRKTLLWKPYELAGVAALEIVARGLPCPMRSSLTDEPCVLLWGHPADSSMRFHKFAAALAAEEVR